jgi:hypothetical protein
MYGKAPSNSLANRPSSRAGSCNYIILILAWGKNAPQMPPGTAVKQVGKSGYI